MTPLIQPFRALRPAPGRAAEVAAPPYDVLTSDEARARAEGRRWSFLRVSKPEIDLPPGTAPHADAAYVAAADNLRAMADAGVLIREARPAYYVYRMTAGDHVQTGLACAASVPAYEANRVRRHELTRPDKELDRARQIDAVNAHTGIVMATHRADARVMDALETGAEGSPVAEADVDGTQHQVWVIDREDAVDRLTGLFEAMDAVYIADGHHRSAAAAQVARWRRASVGDEGAPHERFLIVSFPDDQVQILDYNRVVTDLNGASTDAFLSAVAERLRIVRADGPVRPDRPGTFGLYLGDSWYRLEAPPVPASAAPVERLDVSRLTDLLLGPVLDIGDPRTDPRIDFVGGGFGLDALQRRVDSGRYAVAFSLYPTALADLMAVADAGQVMPPKSTWFEPKLADGLLSLVMD